MKKLLASLVILMISNFAHAGWLVEPVVGYVSGTSSTELLAAYGGTKTASTDTSTLASLKLGYVFGNRISLSAEYAMIMSGQSKQDGGSTADFTGSDMFINVGYEAPMWRAYLGYDLSPTTTFAKTATSAETKYTGTNMKLGLGWMPKNHFAINFEYWMPKYTKYETGGTSYTITDYFSKFDTTAYNINVSFPFMF